MNTAALYGLRKILELLLNPKTYVNDQNRGKSALEIASDNGHIVDLFASHVLRRIFMAYSIKDNIQNRQLNNAQ
jgi:hypothetical protein